MTKLYVLDFDKTLIPYDSWRLFLRKVFWKNPFKVGIVLLYRKIGLISRGEMKRRISEYITKSEKGRSFSQRFSQGISKDILWPSCLCDDCDDRRVLILSASPMCYMRYLEKYLDYDCAVVGSDYWNDKYIEMYGEEKNCYLHEFYPPDQYQYAYAVSDSESDVVWMKKFDHYELKMKRP